MNKEDNKADMCVRHFTTDKASYGNYPTEMQLYHNMLLLI